MNTKVETQTKTKQEIITNIENDFEEDDFLPFEHGFQQIKLRGENVWGLDKHNVYLGGGHKIPFSMLSEKELNKVYNAYQTYITEKY